MMWREVIVRQCEIELRTREIAVPLLRDKSAKRETRSGLNEAKRGGALENNMVLPLCDGARRAAEEDEDEVLPSPPPAREDALPMR